MTIFEQARQMLNDQKENEKKLAQIETLVSDCYHALERDKVNAVEMMKIAKRLRAVLIERRELKEKKAYFQMLGVHCQGILDKEAEHKKRSKERLEKYEAESLISFKRLTK